MTITVCIVEDDVSLRSIYAEWLSEAKDIRLLGQFGNGLQAVAALPQLNPDVVLMDINLPGLNGVECVRQLKTQMPKTQFVMITVYDDPDRVFRALSAGATGYLLKETQRGDLIVSLRAVHRGGSPMSFDIARQVVSFFQQTVSAGPQREMETLSAREQQVLELVGKGYLIKEIGESLQLSQHTVDNYLRRIYEKLHVHSRAQATAKYAKLKVTSVAARG
ncbi:MAG: response regulator transcription factor [Verrucomicrobia bacterium]|jgi:DNA-binding NarL/FixJ family response regulator|nr:response regulator transcription factor [Verrucomicrobiota bacterium]